MNGKNLISGAHCTVTMDNEVMMYMEKFSADLELQREDVSMIGSVMQDSKLTGAKATWSGTVAKTGSKFDKHIKKLKSGIDSRVTFIATKADPDNGKVETRTYTNCWFDKISLEALEGTGAIKEEISGGIGDIDLTKGAD